jgi:hypothetical protein
MSTPTTLSTDCYIDGSGCVVCPAIPASPGSPGRVIVDAQLGWNAGANSVDTVAGDLHLRASIAAAPAGIVVGLKARRNLFNDPALILHGFYVFTSAGKTFIAVMEKGALKTQTFHYRLGALFEIRRVAQSVSYWLDGVGLRNTTALDPGSMHVNACLYAAYDTIP